MPVWSRLLPLAVLENVLAVTVVGMIAHISLTRSFVIILTIRVLTMLFAIISRKLSTK
ncbi:MAG: hypothetical protein AAB619_00045 [Patescibacteria group bacterium]